MTTTRVHGFKELNRVLSKDLRARQARIERAVRRTAVQGAAVVRRKIPVAHSELRDSTHAVGKKIVVDAPYAAAVDKGSRPHMPPIEPLVKWVKLRGAQGLSGKSLKRLTGSTFAGHARSVASQLKALEKPGWNAVKEPGRRGRQVQQGGSSLPLDAATQVAWAIALAIKKHGTKPSHYVERSMPEVMAILDKEITGALPDKA